MNSPKISVIICVYNRGDIIGECLESLAAQTIPLTYFEVIVVDNNSTDNTKEVVASFAQKLPGLRLLTEENQGLSYARNAGMRAAKSEWVASLDSDGKAHANWLETILSIIAKDDFDCFGGPYYAWHFFGPPPAWLPESFGTFIPDHQYAPLDDTKAHIPGGNCAFKVKAAQAVGNFPTTLGMAGDKCAYGEETLMFYKMRDAGFRLGFAPEMLIDHCVMPHKYKYSWHIKSYFALGRAHYSAVSAKIPLFPLRLAYQYAKLAKNCIAYIFIKKKTQKFLTYLLEQLRVPLLYVGYIYEKYFGKR